MPVFISYRRGATTDITGRIHDWLERELGKDAILRDVDSIPPGVRFWQHLERQLVDCDVVVAVVGPDWRRAPESGPDFVQEELQFALKRRIPILPVLVGGVQTSALEALPAAISGVKEYQALTISSGRDFRGNVMDLVKAVKALQHQVIEQRRAAEEALQQQLRQEEAERERAARLEAIRGAELDAITGLARESAGRRSRLIAAITAACLLLAGGVTAFAWSDAQRDRKLQETRAHAERKRLESELDTLTAEFIHRGKEMKQLQQQLNGTQDEVERSRIEKALDEARSDQAKLKAMAQSVQRHGTVQPSGNPQACNCLPGDPLCSCL